MAASIPPPSGHDAAGLSSEEARRRLEKVGANAMPDTALHPLGMALGKFWAPVPWMLEAAVALEVVLGKYVEGAIIAALLVFNAALGLFQESRAQATLAALKSRLALNASVRRDGAWKEDSPRGRGGSGRFGEAVARWRGPGGCETHRG